MFSPKLPLRLILLADSREWARLIRARLAELGSTDTLITAPSWEVASALYDDPQHSVLLCTSEHLPAGGTCPLSVVLLLEEDPVRKPLHVCDWLVRGRLDADTLRRCLRYVGERNQMHHRLECLAEQDPLTGIANRQGFHTLLAGHLDEFQGRGMSLGHLDLDNFKHVNDALGHQAGDRLILQVVARLRGQLDAGDRLARLGSDEFALLIDTHGEPQRSVRIAQRIVEALSEPYWIDGESLLLGCSLGLAHAAVDATADQLMWHAHIAMQQAKREQGCTYQVFDESGDRAALNRVELEADLRQALRRDELELHYQPRMGVACGRILGLEALVRWRHPEHGLLAPDMFVPLAEESGLIVPLGYWVISRALRDMQWLRGRGLGELHMALNLSFRQFQDSQLLPTLRSLIMAHGVDAHWLEFELTETAVMRRSEHVQLTMDALKQLGMRFSLDDFGTGFSSFVHLNSLPITLLKIDKGFVAGMADRPESRQLVKAMIDLAHNLNLEVVAEGVEHVEQLDLLREYDCDQVQGFLISKALPLPELARFLVFGRRRPVLYAL